MSKKPFRQMGSHLYKGNLNRVTKDFSKGFNESKLVYICWLQGLVLLTIRGKYSKGGSAKKQNEIIFLSVERYF